MPASPADGEDLARAVGAIYQDAEAALLEILARALAEGIESPRWAELKLASIGNVRAAVEEVTRALRDDADGAIGRVVHEAYRRGGQSAVAELGMLPEGLRAAAARHLPGARNVDRLAAEAIDNTRPIYRRILRAVPDAYRSIVQRVSGSVLLGGLTRRQATQRALDQLAAKGVTGFVDRAGRNWEMAAYAEMAVRSVTGRAAIQGHIDRLQEVGQELVIVSDAPLECPLCAPWEGEVLAIGGQSGPHTIVEEHAIKDGQPVVVHVAGSLPEARAAGLFHPNCRHSLSLYLPGVTTRPSSPPHPNGATYEDTQRQRYLERQVRAWKRKQAAALDDDARKRAGARVRDYQAAIRQLTEEKGLRRKREREQLPKFTAPSAADPARDDALRIRADADAAHRMTDEELANAAGSGHLRPQDVVAVQAAADQRDLEDLLARVRPGGRMAQDLTGVGDDDLAKVLPHLSPEEALRVAAEMDRRDADAALPGARRDLIGLSDEQLGERARHATGDELAALAAEADRRQLLAEVFPGGRLADDLTNVDDDTLGWAVRYATLDDAERIATELDRRYPVDLPEAHGAATVAGQLADRAVLDEVLAPAAPLDDWAHLRDLPDEDPYAGMSPTERWVAERDAEAEARRTGYTREQVREMYAEHVYAQWLDAEDWARGYLLTKRAELDGVDPRSLFSGPSHIAYARASEELKRYWSEVAPRLTFAEYHEQLTGIRSAAAETARKAKSDRHNRF